MLEPEWTRVSPSLKQKSIIDYINKKLERDCIKSRRNKVGITRYIIMHQVLYNVHVTLFIG